ncbi:MAG: permease-like cell division protein FtsX [Clostridiales bacterium]|nr:permease-like cell division protein FtsX [Candidatus Crickella equi]
MSRVTYSIKESFSQMWRNKGMYFTTIAAMTAMMLILGLFFVAFVNVNMFTQEIEKDYNVIQVYMGEKNDDVANQEVQQQLQAITGVDSLEFVSKDQALQNLKERWGDNAYLLDNLKTNPLPDSFMVYVNDKDSASTVANQASSITGVDDVVFYQDTIDKLAKVTHFIEVGSMVCMIFLVVVSIIIVANTIKLTVFNKAKEIGIMKYLGATDSFVRAPFVLSGMFIGLFSALISTGLIYFIYTKIIEVLGTDIAKIVSVSLVPAMDLVGFILATFAGLGVGIGIIGSFISIARFLRK